MEINKRTFLDGASHSSELSAVSSGAVTAHQNKAVGVFLPMPGPTALGNFAPGGRELLPAAAGLRLAGATAVRMIDRVPGDAAVNRANAAVTRAAGFSEDDLLVLDVPDLADGRIAAFDDLADFAGGQPNLRVPWSRDIKVAAEPALRTIWAPRPGTISMLWIGRPTGIDFKGRLFPTSAGPSRR